MVWILAAISLVLFLAAMLGVAININKSVTGFVYGSESVTITDTSGVITNPASVPAAQPGVLTTHTTNTTGSLTMTNTNHGIVTGQRIDIYWTGGQCYGAVAGTVAGTVVPIASVSGGSNLPSSSTPVTIGIATSCAFEVNGTNLSSLILTTPNLGYFVFNNGSADIVAELVSANYLFEWITGNSAANPLTGSTPTVVYMSHNNTAAAVTTMQAAATYH